VVIFLYDNYDSIAIMPVKTKSTRMEKAFSFPKTTCMQQIVCLAGNSIKPGNGLSLESVIVLIIALVFFVRPIRRRTL
jgi:hypothetical protein